MQPDPPSATLIDESAGARALAGKVALVTGSSRGIGRATAVALAKRGAHIVVHYRERHHQAESVRREIEACGVRAHLVEGDIGDPVRPPLWMAEIRAVFGRLDILVNNAAFVAPNRIAETDPEIWRRIVDVNLKGPFNVIHAALSLLRESRGSIVNVGALNSRAVSPAGSAYVAAKAGLVAMTRNAAVELGHLGIRINVVAPPLTDTEMGAQARTLSGQTRPGLGQGQRIASPTEVAAVILFFCMPEAAYISGETLYMGGGFVPTPA